MRSTRSLQLLPSPLWVRVEATDRVLPMALIELFDVKLSANKILMLN